MPRRRKAVDPQTPDSLLMERMTELQKQISVLRQAKMSSVQPVDIENFNDPVEGMAAVDWPTGRFCWYHDGEWICSHDVISHAMKVFTDRQVNKVLDGAWRFSIDQILDGTELVHVAAGNGTLGSSVTTVQISRADAASETRGLDLLSTPITIDADTVDSYSSGTPPVIRQDGPTNDPNKRMHLSDVIWINTDDVGAGSKGLYVYMYFAPPRIVP